MDECKARPRLWDRRTYPSISLKDPVSVARLATTLCTCDDGGGRGGSLFSESLHDSEFLEARLISCSETSRPLLTQQEGTFLCKFREPRGKRLGFCETVFGECHRTLTPSHSSYGTESVFMSWFVTRQLI
ncbi:1-acyl-sn-glycerol-3-phosphate acyltransferase epsilon [Ixodes scapularis]